MRGTRVAKNGSDKMESKDGKQELVSNDTYITTVSAQELKVAKFR